MLSFAFCTAALLPVAAFAAPALALDGSGTETDPWLIRNADDLNSFSTAVKNHPDALEGTYTVLAGDIDLSDMGEWVPIPFFYGTFDGKGHTVSGMTIAGNWTRSGLFAGIGAGGTVKNVNVSGSIAVSGQNVGGVAGENRGTVSGCTSAVDIVAGDSQTGGVIGQNKGTVIACTYTGTLSGDQEYVGGIVGMNSSGIIRACVNTGSVSGSYAGGIAGSGRGTIEDCYNTGTVTGPTSVGKIAGLKQFFTIENCYYLSTFSSKPNKGEARRTQAQFASGQVAYELNGGVTDGTQAFYQTCGEGLPAFAGKTVYQVKHFACPGDATGMDAYSNENANTTGEHAFTAEVVEPTYLKSAATCTDKAVYYRSCATCGLASDTETFESGEVDPSNHTGEAAWTVQTETEHESIWSCCGKVDVARAAHTWSEGVCEECGYACEHHAEITYSHTASEHTGTCSVCGAVVEGPAAHTWKDGVCTVCGFKRASASVGDKQGEQDGGSSKGSEDVSRKNAAKLPRTSDDSAALVVMMAAAGTAAAAGGALVLSRRR